MSSSRPAAQPPLLERHDRVRRSPGPHFKRDLTDQVSGPPHGAAGRPAIPCGTARPVRRRRRGWPRGVPGRGSPADDRCACDLAASRRAHRVERRLRVGEPLPAELVQGAFLDLDVPVEPVPAEHLIGR